MTALHHRSGRPLHSPCNARQTGCKARQYGIIQPHPSNTPAVERDLAPQEAEFERLSRELAEREEETQATGPQQADRLKQKIAQVRHRLKEIHVQIAELKKSDLYRFMLEVQRAEREGRGLLGDMARELQGRIREARKLLDGLRQQKKA